MHFFGYLHGESLYRYTRFCMDGNTSAQCKPLVHSIRNAHIAAHNMVKEDETTNQLWEAVRECTRVSCLSVDLLI